MEVLLAVAGGLVAYTFASLRILKQYERGVAFLLGKPFFLFLLLL